MHTRNITAPAGKVVVAPAPILARHASGITGVRLCAVRDQSECFGRVVAAGTMADIKEGDMVLWRQGDGTLGHLDGQPLLTLSHASILALLTEE